MLTNGCEDDDTATGSDEVADDKTTEEVVPTTTRFWGVSEIVLIMSVVLVLGRKPEIVTVEPVLVSVVRIPSESV